MNRIRGMAAGLVRPVWLGAMVAVWLAGTALGGVSLHPLFTDNLVLQREVRIPVYGKGTPGDHVKVTLAGPQAAAEAETTVGDDGKWMAFLPAQAAADQPHTLTVNDQTLTNVLIGDVWVCAGQSNMEGKVNSEKDFDQSTLYGKNIRFAEVKVWHNDEKWDTNKTNFTAPDRGPQDERPLSTPWTVASAENAAAVGRASCAGMILAREIADGAGVPVGLIQNAMGGTCVEAWTPTPYFETPLGRQIVSDYYELRRAWSGGSQNKTGKPQDEPGVLYNTLMHPITQYAIKGIVWWQGEHNSSSWDYQLKKAENYAAVFPVFIRAMRERFVNAAPDFPFLIIQLHPYGGRTKPGESHLAQVRWGQWLASVEQPNCGIGVGHDVVGVGGIHPSNRSHYATRAARVALGKWYGKGEKWQPSGFVGMDVAGGVATIHFTPGLKLSTDDGKPPSSFVIMDGKGAFHEATARIVGDTTVQVTAAGVDTIREVRYAFADVPETNLVNENGLPVSTFRAVAEEAGAAGAGR